MDALRFVWHFLVIAPLRAIADEMFSSRIVRRLEAHRKQLRAEWEVGEDERRLAVRYGPLGWGALGACPHRTGDRFYTTRDGATVRFENASWAGHVGRASHVLMPDGRILNAGIAQDGEEARGVASGDLHRVA